MSQASTSATRRLSPQRTGGRCSGSSGAPPWESQAWARLVASRDPVTASRSRGHTSTAPAVVAARAGQSSPSSGPRARVKLCTWCGSEHSGKGRSCGSAECMHLAKGAAVRGRSRPRALTDAERAALVAVETDSVDAMVRELQAAGASSRSIGAALGLLGWQMSD